MTQQSESPVKVKIVADGEHNGLAQYKVLVNGEYVGDVSQMIASRVVAYSGKMYGRAVTRKAWQWIANEGGGDFELTSRKAAVDGLVAYVTR